MTDLPALRLKALVSFPATVTDGSGIDVIKENGNYRFDIAFDDFAPPVAGIPDPANQTVLIWNSATDSYALAPVSLFGVGGSVPEAPNDGQQYARQSLSWTVVAPPSGGGGTPSDAIPIMDATPGVAGVATTFARGDHKHPSDTSRLALTGGTMTGQITLPAAPSPANDQAINKGYVDTQDAAISTTVSGKQAADADLTAVAALSGTGIARRTGADAWSVGDPVTNTDLATMSAYTIKANNSPSSAAPVDVRVDALPLVSFDGNDFMVVSDTSAAGAFKRVGLSTFPGATSIGEAPIDGTTYGRKDAGWAAVAAGGVTPEAMTKTDDTNVTLTLSGLPATSLLKATNIAAGWTGRLALTRFVTGSALSVLGVTGNATADHASIAAGVDGDVLRRSGSVLGFGQLATAAYGNSTVTYAKIQNVVNDDRFLGRISGANGVIEELTGTQATTLLDTFQPTLKGLVPSPAGATTTFLKADGTWAAPPVGQPTDGDLTAIAALTGTGIARRTGTDTWTVGTLVTNAELALMPTFTFKGNNTAGSLAPADLRIDGLTAKATPTGSDMLIISDTAAAGAIKRIDISTLPAPAGTPLLSADNTWTGIQGYDETALTPTSPITWNVDSAPVATVALNTGATTMNAPTSVVAGRVYTIRFANNATPGTVVWNTAFDFAGGSVPTITAAANAIDRFTFIGRSGGILEEIGRSQNISSL